MGSKSDYLEAKFLNHVLGNTAYSAPATVYVGLFTIAPSDTGGGTEVTGGSYARAVPANSSGANNTTNWPNATGSGAGGSTKTNGTAIAFPTATADWGTAVAFGLFDAASAGNLLYWGALNAPNGKLIQNGDTFTLPATTGIVVTED